jgi:hypothetical protein
VSSTLAGFSPGGFDLDLGRNFLGGGGSSIPYDWNQIFQTGIDAGSGFAGFSPGGFDLNLGRNFLGGGGSSIPSFQTGIDAGSGSAGSSGVAGKFKGLFDGLFNNDTTKAVGVASMVGNFGLEAANRYNQSAEVQARNNQIALGDDFLDQYNAAKLKQGLAINPEQRQRNLMGVIPELANSISSSTGSPDSGFQSAARAARLLA